jgi:hypothetical protein
MMATHLVLEPALAGRFVVVMHFWSPFLEQHPRFGLVHELSRALAIYRQHITTSRLFRN